MEEFILLDNSIAKQTVSANKCFVRVQVLNETSFGSYALISWVSTLLGEFFFYYLVQSLIKISSDNTFSGETIDIRLIVNRSFGCNMFVEQYAFCA